MPAIVFLRLPKLLCQRVFVKAEPECLIHRNEIPEYHSAPLVWPVLAAPTGYSGCGLSDNSLDHAYVTRMRIHEHSHLAAMPVKRQQFSNINKESLQKLSVNYWHK